jgi:hypothetical protein
MKTISDLGQYLESRENLLTRSGCSLPPGYKHPSSMSPPPGNALPVTRSDAPPGDNPFSPLSNSASLLASLSPPGDSPPSPPGDSFLFLVQDLSPAVIELLGSYLSIPPQVFIQHTSGGETVCHRGHKGSKSHTLCKGCSSSIQPSRRPLGLDTEISSMTWWSAGAYSPKMHSLASQVQDELKYPFERVAWKKVTVPSATAADTDLIQPARRLDCGIFRAYQVITELEPHGVLEAYTCALEERATSYMCANNCGS